MILLTEYRVNKHRSGYQGHHPPKAVVLCLGQIQSLPLCQAYPFLLLGLPLLCSCLGVLLPAKCISVSTANQLPVRFSQRELLAWHLEGRKRGEAWCFCFFFSASGSASCWGYTSCAVLSPAKQQRPPLPSSHPAPPTAAPVATMWSGEPPAGEMVPAF